MEMINGNASIILTGIRADDGTTPNPLIYQGKQCFGFGIGNYLSPYLNLWIKYIGEGRWLAAHDTKVSLQVRLHKKT
jgi:hypothetical protein